MNKHRGLLIIVIMAGIFILPNLFLQRMHIGADALFHYNRFYETAMQLKEWNFNPFISLYGFAQTGRIVNAVYGPAFAYLQGVLVLLAGSWYHYQIISNFILYMIAGASMLLLLRKANVREGVAVSLAIIFMTTYTIQYWTMNQGFTSWGGALLPICLIPVLDMLRDAYFPWVKVAAAMAVMTQVHMLSAVFLAIIYFLAFILFFISTPRKKFLLQLIQAMGLYGLLVLNVLSNFLVVYSGNTLQMPFVNQEMASRTINVNESYWLINPGILLLLFLIGLGLRFLKRPTLTDVTKKLFLLSLIFLILSSSLLPWDWLVSHKVPFIGLIQFPFRFFVPSLILFFLYCGLRLEEVSEKLPWQRILMVFAVLASGQLVIQTSIGLMKWEHRLFDRKHSFVVQPLNKVREAFFVNDLSAVFEVYVKSTPDYLPIYEENAKNKYERYEEEILFTGEKVQSFTKNGQLIVNWTEQHSRQKHVPVFIYHGTNLTLNGKRLIKATLTDIGTPIVGSRIGENQLIVQYHVPKFVSASYWLTACSWGFLGLSWAYKRKNE